MPCVAPAGYKGRCPCPPATIRASAERSKKTLGFLRREGPAERRRTVAGGHGQRPEYDREQGSLTQLVFSSHDIQLAGIDDQFRRHDHKQQPYA